MISSVNDKHPFAVAWQPRAGCRNRYFSLRDDAIRRLSLIANSRKVEAMHEAVSKIHKLSVFYLIEKIIRCNLKLAWRNVVGLVVDSIGFVCLYRHSPGLPRREIDSSNCAIVLKNDVDAAPDCAEWNAPDLPSRKRLVTAQFTQAGLQN